MNIYKPVSALTKVDSCPSQCILVQIVQIIHVQYLTMLYLTYKMVFLQLSGFTLNMLHTDQETITYAVYATGVWGNDSPGVDFALAVHVHPYSHSVLSVQVYVASLERLRQTATLVNTIAQCPSDKSIFRPVCIT